MFKVSSEYSVPAALPSNLLQHDKNDEARGDFDVSLIFYQTFVRRV